MVPMLGERNDRKNSNSIWVNQSFRNILYFKLNNATIELKKHIQNCIIPLILIFTAPQTFWEGKTSISHITYTSFAS